MQDTNKKPNSRRTYISCVSNIFHSNEEIINNMYFAMYKNTHTHTITHRSQTIIHCKHWTNPAIKNKTEFLHNET